MENLFFDLRRLKHLGQGAIVGKTVRIRRPEDVSIGDHTIIDDFTYISCAADIGNYCHIAPQVTVGGGAGYLKMGDFVGIGAGSCIYTASSDYFVVSLDLPSVPREFQFGGTTASVEIGDCVLLGAHTIILPGAKLPEGLAGGAQSIFNKGAYEAWTLYDGNCPLQCRKVKRRGVEKAIAAMEQCRIGRGGRAA
jgi:acetyltransferase-like isoleucine patch superfamily enzyme